MRMMSKYLSVAAAGLLAWPVLTAAHTLYVAPRGTGRLCTADEPCSLVSAQSEVRRLTPEMSEDIVVELADGTYRLSQTLEFLENSATHDSGRHGHDVIWRAADRAIPVLSGSMRLTGWTLYDAHRNIFRTRVSPTFNTRQLYVNGVRAVRTRRSVDPTDFVVTTLGVTAQDSSIARWRNIHDVEMVMVKSWAASRCRVASVQGRAITMGRNCWANSPGRQISWIENVFEDLSTPGQWYLDRTAHFIYYIPRPGENLSTADVEVPVLQRLLTGNGTASTPLHNLIFRGLCFSYAGWTYPSDSDDGFAELQNNFSYNGPVSSRNYSGMDVSVVPGNVSFSYVHHIRLEGDTFSHLGAIALEFLLGSQDNEITGNRIFDVSGSGIQMGDVSPDYHHPSDPADLLAGNVIAENEIHNVAAEYLGGTAISVTFAQRTLIAHNELYSLPYSGISIGWGWGLVDPECAGYPGCQKYSTITSAGNNIVTGNYIHDYLLALNDGGAIYALGAQPRSLIFANYAVNQHADYGAIYLDSGSAGWLVSGNVLRAVHGASRMWLTVQVILQPGPAMPATGNRIEGNFTDAPNSSMNATQNEIGTNITATEDWPPAAKRTMCEAGLTARSPGSDPLRAGLCATH